MQLTPPRSNAVPVSIKDESRLSVGWERLLTNNPPQKRKGHTAVALNRGIYVFGGYAGNHLGDLWKLDTDTLRWRRIEASGISPCNRAGHTACILDTTMVIFGGECGSAEPLNDLWKIELGTENSQLQWQRIEPLNSPPKPRYGHSAVIVQDRLLIFGGFGNQYLDDLWEYDFSTRLWARLDFAAQDPRPSRRCHHVASMVESNYMLIHGGSNGRHLDDLWEYDITLQQWRPIHLNTDLLPLARAKHAIATMQGLMLIHGGSTGLFRESDTWIFYRYPTTPNHNGNSESAQQLASNNITVPIGGEWIRLEIDGVNFPIPRDSHCIACIGSDLWLVGGNGKGEYLNDVWFCSLEAVTDALHSYVIAGQNRDVTITDNDVGRRASLNDNCDSRNKDTEVDGEEQRRHSIADEDSFVVEDKSTTDTSTERTSPIRQGDHISGSIDENQSNLTDSIRNSSPASRFNSSAEGPIAYNSPVSRLPETPNNSNSIRQPTTVKRTPPPASVVSPPRIVESFSNDPIDPIIGIAAVGSQPTYVTQEELALLTRRLEKLERLNVAFSSVAEEIQENERYLEERVNGTEADLRKRLKQTEDRLRDISMQTNELNHSLIEATEKSAQMQYFESRLQQLEHETSTLSQNQDRFFARMKDHFEKETQRQTHMQNQINNIEKYVNKQAEAILNIEAVLNKEIQTRMAGEHKTEMYYNVMSQQLASQLQMQVKQYSLSVHQMEKMLATVNAALITHGIPPVHADAEWLQSGQTALSALEPSTSSQKQSQD